MQELLRNRVCQWPLFSREAGNNSVSLYSEISRSIETIELISRDDHYMYFGVWIQMTITNRKKSVKKKPTSRELCDKRDDHLICMARQTRCKTKINDDNARRRRNKSHDDIIDSQSA